MSYLNLPNGLPDFTKAIISFWFRVPLKTLQKARDAYATFNFPNIPFSVDGNLTNGGVRYTTMAGIVPLVTFGRPQTTNFYSTPPVAAGSYTNTTYRWNGSGPGGEFNPGPWVVLSSVTSSYSTQPAALALSDWQLPPCYIGVECIPAADASGEDLYTLKIHLQMDKSDSSNRVGLAYSEASATVPDPFTQYSAEGFSSGGFHGPGFEKDGAWGHYLWTNDEHLIIDGYTPPLTDQYFPTFWPPLATNTFTSNYEDVSNTDLAPEFFELGGQESSRSTDTWALAITPDHWHHVLFSIDLSNEINTHGRTWREANDGAPPDPASNTTSATQAWIALDGVNIDKDGMSEFWPNGLTTESPGYSDPNALLSAYAYWTTQTVARFHSQSVLSGNNSYVIENNTGIVKPTFSYTSAGLPSAMAAMGFPATPDQVDNIYNIELAEFQMFTGIALDTSDPTKLRLFIDANGKPVPPNQKTNPDTGQTSGSIEGLGQQPDIMLHGSSNWKQGTNTGRTGVMIDPDTGKTVANPKGQFTPTALITPYKPDPSLHGPQGPT